MNVTFVNLPVVEQQSSHCLCGPSANASQPLPLPSARYARFKVIRPRVTAPPVAESADIEITTERGKEAEHGSRERV